MESTTCPCCKKGEGKRTGLKRIGMSLLGGAVLTGGGALIFPLLVIGPIVMVFGLLSGIAAVGNGERKCDECEFVWIPKITWVNTEKKIAKLARKHAIKKRIEVPA